MKIVLVNPALSHQELYGDWDLSSVKSFSTPLGLLSLAAVAIARGHEVALVDGQARGLRNTEITEAIVAQRPDVIGMTGMTVYMPAIAQLAALLKEKLPQVPIILGGPHITALAEETMAYAPAIDIGVVGEGEETFAALLDMYARRQDNASIPGVVVRRDGRIIHHGRRDFIKDLDTLPVPAWQLIPDLKSHSRLSVLGTRQRNSLGLVTSRGCPGQCIFCDRGVFGNRFRCYSGRYVVDMLQGLVHDYGITDFLFYDDLFVGNKIRLREICRLLEERRLSISWSCCARVDYVEPELLVLMKQSGCWMIEYGIESGSQPVLDCMKKGVTIAQMRQAIRWTKEAGIIAKGNFIFGNFLETKDTLEESLRLAISSGLDYFQHTFFVPLPGSQAYTQAASYGSFQDDWTQMSTFKINFIPTALTGPELLAFSKKAWKRFYLRPRIIWQELLRLRNPQAFIRLFLALKAFVHSTLLR